MIPISQFLSPKASQNNYFDALNTNQKKGEENTTEFKNNTSKDGKMLRLDQYF